MPHFIARITHSGAELTYWAPSETDAQRYVAGSNGALEYVRPVDPATSLLENVPARYAEPAPAREYIIDEQDTALYNVYAALRAYGDTLNWTPDASHTVARHVLTDLDGRVGNLDIGAWHARYTEESEETPARLTGRAACPKHGSQWAQCLAANCADLGGH